MFGEATLKYLSSHLPLLSIGAVVQVNNNMDDVKMNQAH